MFRGSIFEFRISPHAGAEAEGQFIDLLHGLSSWSDEATPNVHALLVALAGCIDEGWANALATFTLRYAAAWNE